MAITPRGPTTSALIIFFKITLGANNNIHNFSSSLLFSLMRDEKKNRNIKSGFQCHRFLVPPNITYRNHWINIDQWLWECIFCATNIVNGCDNALVFLWPSVKAPFMSNWENHRITWLKRSVVLPNATRKQEKETHSLSFATAKILFQALFPAMSYHLLLNIVNNAYRARLATLFNESIEEFRSNQWNQNNFPFVWFGPSFSWHFSLVRSVVFCQTEEKFVWFCLVQFALNDLLITLPTPW